MGRQTGVAIRSEPGLIYVYVSPAEPGAQPGWRYASWVHAPDWSAWSRQGPRWWDRLGFGHYVGGNQSGGRVDLYIFPYYAAAAASAMLPGLLLIRFLRTRRRFAKGLCPVCGYDLRATPQRCPECGTIVVRRRDDACAGIAQRESDPSEIFPVHQCKPNRKGG
jgi:hypothetical protein